MGPVLNDVIFVADQIVFFITDAACELNFDGFWSDEGVGPAALAKYRRLLIADEVIEMTLILPGTHRLRFHAGPGARLTPARGFPLVHDPSAGDSYVDQRELVLPTGRVVVRSDGRDAETVPAITVPPGTYYVSVEWNVSQESRHHMLVRVEDYPPTDGPDGVITLVRKGPVRQTTTRR